MPRLREGQEVYTVAFSGEKPFLTGAVELWADDIEDAIKKVRKEIPNCGEIKGVREGRRKTQ